jgi:5-formyltetrahydrofolate cyclo-ligase
MACGRRVPERIPSSVALVPRHDHDAGGDPGLLAAKAALREEAWAALSVAGVTRFPSPYGRIPNFVGAEAAARRLAETAEWDAAATLKANPDSPQWPVRQRALEDGKTVYMAVPRLAENKPFFLLDPARLAETPRAASSIRGASRSARTIDLGELQPVDLVVAGCVAVGEDGARLGKGGGFSDLEFAVAAAAGLIGRDTVVATTVHEGQVFAAGRIPTTGHDVWLDLIVTPDRVIRLPPSPPAGRRRDPLGRVDRGEDPGHTPPGPDARRRRPRDRVSTRRHRPVPRQGRGSLTRPAAARSTFVALRFERYDRSIRSNAVSGPQVGSNL